MSQAGDLNRKLIPVCYILSVLVVLNAVIIVSVPKVSVSSVITMERPLRTRKAMDFTT